MSFEPRRARVARFLRAPFRDRPTLTSWALIVVTCFCAYGATSSALTGYEPETAAVTEGLVRNGDFALIPTSPLKSEGVVGREGKLYGRVGIPQPLLEAPFYAAGYAADIVVKSDTDAYTYRRTALELYNPVIVALTAGLVFLIALEIGGFGVLEPRRAATLVALLFGLASIALPYAKIGMEPTLMGAFALSLLAALRARRAPPDAAGRWFALFGFAGGMSTAIKPYAMFTIAPLLVLLWPVVRASPRVRQLKLAALLLLPALAWGAAFCWYNWQRNGSIFDVGNSPYSPTWAAPFNFAGMLVSPGKGMLLYSPLVLLGMIAWARCASRDRTLFGVLLAAFVLGVGGGALSAHWTDETWGPRYAVYVAWLPLLSLPWWLGARVRRRVLSVGVVIAVLVQLVAVSAPYTVYLGKAPTLTGAGLFESRVTGKPAPPAPLGRDSMRWVPQLSPLLFQTALELSRVSEKFGGSGWTYVYKPYDGKETRTSLAKAKFPVLLPDMWWGFRGAAAKLGALLLLVACLAGVWLSRRAASASAAPAQ